MSTFHRAVLGAAIALLAACGSNDGTPPLTPPSDDDVVSVLGLSGTVPAAAALKGAGVTVTVAQAQVQATVGTDNTYNVTLSDVPKDAFISVSVRGDGERSDIELGSLVGTAAALAVAAGADGVATVDEVPALALNSLNTAAAGYVLEPGGLKMRAGASQPPLGDAALSAAYAQIDTTAQLGLAAVIEQVVRDRIALPTGVATTAVLARSPGAREAFVAARIQSDTEGLRDTAVALADAGLSDTLETFPIDFHFTDTLFYAERFLLAADGTAVVEGYASTLAGTAATWTEQEGVLRVALEPGYVPRRRDVDGDGDPFNDDPVEAWEQVVYELRLIGDTVPHGPQRVPAMLDRQSRRSFPGTQLPEEIDRRIYFGDVVLTENLPALTAARLTGRTVALEVPYREGSAIGARTELVQFQSGGAGMLTVSGSPFAWAIAGNVLTLDFADGTQGQYRLIGDIDGRAERYTAVYAFPDYPWDRHTTVTMVPGDTDAAVDAAGRYLSWGGTLASHLGLISLDEIRLEPGGSGELRQTSNTLYPSTGRLYFEGAAQTTVVPVQWSGTATGIEIDEGDHGCAEPPCPPHYRRMLEPVRVDGERVYVIESLYNGDVLLQKNVRRYDRRPLP